MINKVLQIVAPHHCYGCAKIGTVLCPDCKYDIVDESLRACVVCNLPAGDGICEGCRTAYDKAWCVGDRSGSLMAVIDGLKFRHVKDAAGTLAELLDATLPVLPPNAVFVPIPSLPSHIRQRGYDHTLLIARTLAKRRRSTYEQLLSRTAHDVQRGKSKKDRFRQAACAYECRKTLQEGVPYVLIDDVVTTNATLRYAAEALRRAGATVVWAGVVARQPLDK